MIKKILGALDRWMERKGRKLMRVSGSGEVVFYRYCLLRREAPNADQKLGTPANLYLHIWKRETEPDGGGAHSHSGDTYSLILRGWYREVIDGVERLRRPLSVTRMRAEDQHRILSCKKDTVSLFLRLRARRGMEVSLPECKTPCKICQSINGSTCFNRGKVFPLELVLQQMEASPESKGKKFGDWMVCNDESRAWLERRRRAMARMPFKIPEEGEQAQLLLRERSKLPELYYQHVGDHEMAEKVRLARLARRAEDFS